MMEWEWIMTIAAGIVLGYFLVQYLTRNARIAEKTENSNTEAEPVRTEAGGAEAQAQPVRRLHKSRTNKKFAGVCGGIAEYLQTDPSVVRLVTVVLMLGWGSGLLAYIICARVLPEE